MINFKIEKKIPNALGRAGLLETPHGVINTPAFVAVGTKATVKSLTPEQIAATGSQVVLANTYHLYLQPGEKIIKEAGGLGKFMNWSGPTMTDSGGFQAFSLGVAYGGKLSKFIASDSPTLEEVTEAYDENKEKKAKITEDGVEFRSIIDGSTHFFSPEKSIQIQQDIGADIIFAFDECTSPHATPEYLRLAMERTHRWAERCLREHKRISPPLAPPEGRGTTFGYQTADRSTWVAIKERALEMRKNPTKAEEILWEALRRGVTNFHFRRQHTIGYFVVDFVCLQKRLVVEVDGGIHDEQKERDEERTRFLEESGFTVVRFKNEEVLNDLNNTVEKITRHLKALSFGEGLGGAGLNQSLFGIVQGGRSEELRKESANIIGNMDFDGFGVGGSFVKEDMANAVRWVNEILPEEKPRHLLGVGEPIDILLGVENGCDTFDCVAATRMARNGTLYTENGKINIMNAKYREDFSPFLTHYTYAYIHHLFHAHEMLAATLATIHNLSFLNKFCDDIREAILDGRFIEFKEEFLRIYR